jgi:hypothetical protein
LLAESGFGALGVCACGGVIAGVGVEVAGGASLAIWGACCDGAYVFIGGVEAHPGIRRGTEQRNAIRVVFEIGNCMS